MQLSINWYDEADGIIWESGHGYRIFGPKFLGSGELIKRHVLDERDVREIREYLDKFEPRPVPDAAP
jgi:hypothetical protein